MWDLQRPGGRGRGKARQSALKRRRRAARNKSAATRRHRRGGREHSGARGADRRGGEQGHGATGDARAMQRNVATPSSPSFSISLIPKPSPDARRAKWLRLARCACALLALRAPRRPLAVSRALGFASLRLRRHVAASSAPRRTPALPPAPSYSIRFYP